MNKKICLNCGGLIPRVTCKCINPQWLEVATPELPAPSIGCPIDPFNDFHYKKMYALCEVVKKGVMSEYYRIVLETLLSVMGYDYVQQAAIVDGIEAEGLALRSTWELHDGDQVRGTLKGHVCADCVSAYGGNECRCGHPVWTAEKSLTLKVNA